MYRKSVPLIVRASSSTITQKLLANRSITTAVQKHLNKKNVLSKGTFKKHEHEFYFNQKFFAQNFHCIGLNSFSTTSSKSIILTDRRDTSGLKGIFEPESVAVVGATDRAPSVGRTIVNNLILGNEQGGKRYKIYPVNPTRKTVLNLPCYPSIEAIPDFVDMVVIVTPAKSCLDVMRQCAKKNVKAAVVISAGFKEAGPSGVQLEKDLIQIARDANIRVIGPNCVGVMNPNFGLNATFAATMGLPGNVAFISQSGAMCTAILDWSLQKNIGFSAFISVGSMADVHWGDLLDYLGSDINTKSILIYMETIGDASAFIGAAREVGLTKPISVIKAGKSDAAAQAAASHTGSLAGSYAAFEAAMSRVGVLTADTIQELSDVTLVLSKQPRPKGPRLMIITNAGGPAVLATDSTISSGAHIAKLSQQTLTKLNEFLPPAWSHSNPVDILGDASAELYAKTLETLIDDPNSDGVLVVLSPQDVTDPTKTAQALIEASKKSKQKGIPQKPILAAWMGGDTVKEGFDLLSSAGIPTFAQPDAAATTFGRLWKQVESIDKLYGPTEYPAATFFPSINTKQEAMKLINQVYKDQRTLLTESESKQILNLYGIETAQTILASTKKEAENATKNIKSQYYVVKLNSKTLTHKADVGGVQLNLTASQVPEAFAKIQKSVTAMHGAQHFQGVTVQPMIQLDKGIELILGSTYDPQFGPVMLFGSGGTMVEVYKDTTLAIPPIDDNIAEAVLKKTRIYKALKGGHGKRFQGVDIPKLKSILLRFSHMIVDLVDVMTECDINPLLATIDQQFIALDARVVLRKTPEKTSPVRARRPYPVEYFTQKTLPTIGTITFRPTTAADKAALCAFHKSLSSKTVKERYLEDLSYEKRTELTQLISLCFPDYDRQISMIALKDEQIIALCELERPPPNHLQRHCGQIRILVADQFQNKGLGKLITQHTMEVAKKEGLKELHSVTLKQNVAFTKLVARLGWKSTELEHDKDSIITSVKL